MTNGNGLLLGMHEMLILHLSQHLQHAVVALANMVGERMSDQTTTTEIELCLGQVGVDRRLGP